MDVNLENENNNNNRDDEKVNLDKIQDPIESSCSDTNLSTMADKSGHIETHTLNSGTHNNNDKTRGPISERLVQQNVPSTEDNNNRTGNATDCKNIPNHQGSTINTHIGNKPLTSILTQEHRQRTKKFSHPMFVPNAAQVNVSVGGDHLHSPTTSSPFFTNQYIDSSPKFSRNMVQPHAPAIGGSRSPVMRRIKKHSMPVVPILSLNDAHEDEEDDVTKRLETAVRRISRGSPNRQGYGGNSPLIGRTSPNRFVCSPQEESPIGLSGLARGYEQYREWLTTLRPTTEFGEPSSDDLSSEWESSAELELVRAYGSSMTLKNSLSLASNVASSSTSTQINSHTTVQRRRSAEERQKEMQKKGHYRRPVDDTIDDDEEDEIKNKDCAVCRGDTIPEGDGTSTKNEDTRQDFLHHKQHSMKRVSGWRKVRNMVQWTPFVQTFKNKKYQWVQLAGHSGNFKAGKCQGTVLKKLCAQEEHCYKQFNLNNGDPIKEYVPGYQGIITLEDDEKFIQLQDCLSSFNLPSIMDCKIGVRTYLEEELAKAKEKPKLRNDMYNKMVAVDSSAPTEEETRLKGVTKPRYMVWRETISSTATLGFRLEGIKKSDGSSSKDFKTTKTKEQVSDAFRNFTSSKCDTVRQYLDRLKEIKIALEQSEFFRTHELIGSSLLFVHDTTKANVWLIDFGKTVPAPNGITIDHKSPWEVGNHEDGYLIGVQNLINIFSDLAVELNTATPTPENHLKTRNSPHHDSRSAILKDDLTNSNVRIDSAKHDMSGPSVMSIESKEDAPIIKNISDSGEVRNNS